MIEIRKPTLNQLPSYLAMIEEMRQVGETIWEGMVPKNDEDAFAFVERLNRAGTTPEPGLVPESIYWGFFSGEIVGRITLRHHLTDKLKELGGNVGYEVRPSFRRKGVAKEMLRLLLETPKAREIGNILITCGPDNIGSNKAIIANGGILEKTAFVPRWNRDTNYYWIKLVTDQ